MILETTSQTTNGVVVENILHDSSNVIKTSYNYSTKQLYVTFKRGGSVYYYNNVEHTTYEGLKIAESVGTYINKSIKPQHTFVEVGKASQEILTEMVNKVTTFKSNDQSKSK